MGAEYEKIRREAAILGAIEIIAEKLQSIQGNRVSDELHAHRQTPLTPAIELVDRFFGGPAFGKIAPRIMKDDVIDQLVITAPIATRHLVLVHTPQSLSKYAYIQPSESSPNKLYIRIGYVLTTNSKYRKLAYRLVDAKPVPYQSNNLIVEMRTGQDSDLPTLVVTQIGADKKLTITLDRDTPTLDGITDEDFELLQAVATILDASKASKNLEPIYV